MPGIHRATPQEISGCKSKHFAKARNPFRAVLLLSRGRCWPPSPAAIAHPSPDVVATVNGKDILRSELERNYQIVKAPGDSPQEPSPEQADIARLTILDQMIDDEILQQRAAKLNLAASDEDVNAKLTEVKAPYTQEEFDKQLKELQRHAGRLQARAAPQPDQRQAAQQGDRVEDQHHRRGDQQLLRRAQGRLQPHRAALRHRPDRGHAKSVAAAAANANLQNNKATSDADAKKKIQALQQARKRRRLCRAGRELLRRPKHRSNGGDMGFVFESALRQSATPDVYDAISKLKPGQFTTFSPMYPGPGPSAPHRRLRHLQAHFARSRRPARAQRSQRAAVHPPAASRSAHAQLLRTAYFEVMRSQTPGAQLLRRGDPEERRAVAGALLSRSTPLRAAPTALAVDPARRRMLVALTRFSGVRKRQPFNPRLQRDDAELSGSESAAQRTTASACNAEAVVIPAIARAAYFMLPLESMVMPPGPLFFFSSFALRVPMALVRPFLCRGNIRLHVRSGWRSPHLPCAGTSGSGRPWRRRNWRGRRPPDSDTQSLFGNQRRILLAQGLMHLLGRLHVAFAVIVDARRHQLLQRILVRQGPVDHARPCRPPRHPSDRRPAPSSATSWHRRTS